MKTRIVIIGGGFAGLNLIKHLAGKEEFDVMLVDMNNYHLFPPLLYQVATGFLDVSNIAYPFRKFFHGKENIHFRLGKLQKVMPEDSKVLTYEALLKMGVEIHPNAQVKDYINDTVIFSDGKTIETQILLWTAGVTARIFEGLPQECYGRGNRLLVNEYNKVSGTGNIYAIGDTCLLTSDGNFPQGHPQLAQVALQQGRNLAANLVAVIRNQPLTSFTYNDKGSLAIIGRNKAVADFPAPALHLKGFMAWVIWLFVHLFSLVTYRNRFMTLLAKSA